MQCIHIVPLYTIATTMFGCCLLLGCEKYRQTTRFVVVFHLFPYASWRPAQRQQNIREKEAPQHPSHTLCVIVIGIRLKCIGNSKHFLSATASGRQELG